jgi:hypothetical protein
MSKILTRQIYLTMLIIQIFGGIFLENFIEDRKSAVAGGTATVGKGRGVPG